MNNRGFTLLELLIVIAIIGVLAAIVIAALDASRTKSRDASRASQAQEFAKALELYYLANGTYPDDGVPDPGGAIVLTQGSTVGGALSAAGFLSRVPPDPTHAEASGYRYCASDNGATYAILINTERDGGGTDYCAISAGTIEYDSALCTVPEPAGGADTGLALIDRCTSRF